MAKAVEAVSENKSAKAQARHVRISARKVRLVIDLIRGKEVEEAITILKFNPKAAAKDVGKVVASAKANAENNMGLKGSLFISEAFVNEGPTLKRFRPRARGRASRINKRTCHIMVVVSKEEGA
ncbi:MAG: 50S ribosomal protein L22 [Actinomycetota bacterium]|nr:50S ribosomal protein L22 [Actinomycetota bacterium]